MYYIYLCIYRSIPRSLDRESAESARGAGGHERRSFGGHGVREAGMVKLVMTRTLWVYCVSVPERFEATSCVYLSMFRTYKHTQLHTQSCTHKGARMHAHTRIDHSYLISQNVVYSMHCTRTDRNSVSLLFQSLMIKG